MMRSLDPFIRSAAKKYTGGESPVILGRAKIDLLKSLPKYNPRVAAPNTFVNSQLQGLQRWSQSRVNGVRIPSRAPSQAIKLETMSSELEDELGRPPSTVELARKAGLTVTAIDKIRSFKRPTPGSTEYVAGDEEDSVNAEDQIVRPPNDDVWLEMIYDELSDRDRVILEHTIGMFGRPKLSTNQLAKRLKISPGAISQRRRKLQTHIDRLMEINPL